MPEWTRAKIGVRFLGADTFRHPLSREPAVARRPVENQRRPRILEQLGRLSALVVGVEDEAALVEARISTMRAFGAPSASAVASVIADGSGSSAASAARYHWANSAIRIGRNIAFKQERKSVDMEVGNTRRKKKCPTVEYLGVAQSPKPSISGTL